MRFGRKEEEGCVRLQGFLSHTNILKKKGIKLNIKGYQRRALVLCAMK